MYHNDLFATHQYHLKKEIMSLRLELEQLGFTASSAANESGWYESTVGKYYITLFENEYPPYFWIEDTESDERDGISFVYRGPKKYLALINALMEHDE